MLLHPPFPRSSTVFSGGAPELQRVAELLADEVLSLIRLLALDERATAEVVAALAHRLGRAGADPAEIWGRPGGGPLLIRQLLEAQPAAADPQELIALVERDEIAAAKELLDRILFQAASFSMGDPLAALQRGIVLGAEGDLPGARAMLQRAIGMLEGQGGQGGQGVSASAAPAAYYLGQALLGLGDLEGARLAAQRALRLAREAGLVQLVARAEVLQAQALLLSFQPAAARACAQRIVEQGAGGEAEPGAPRRVQAAAWQVLARAHALHRDLPAAQAALQAAAAAIDADGESLGAGRYEHDVACVELFWLFGCPVLGARAEWLARAERACRHYAERGRRFMEARAVLALCGALLSAEAPLAEELDRVERLLERAQALCSERAYGLLYWRCALYEAAWLRRRGEERRARDLLARAAGECALPEDCLERRLLRAAAGAGGNEDPVPGVRVILGQLGLQGALPFEIIDRCGVREADESERQRVLAVHDLVVELERGTIARGGGGPSITGRPLMAALLAQLVAARDEVNAERLFHDVWGGRQYHPLQHRNTIHVAITRLRQALRGLLPGREVVLTTAHGWRLAPDVDICAIRPRASG